MPRSPSRLPFAALLALLLAAVGTRAAAQEPAIRFARDVRPILAKHCFACHGPDAAEREADLRLDLADEATKERDGLRPVAPGHPESSEALRRIKSKDPAERMPPVETGKGLGDGEIRTIEAWIRQGAGWETHWSYAPPRPQAPPEVADAGAVRDDIDRFVLAELESRGLGFSPPADRRTLARRLSFALRGLPPTRDELHAYLADESPDADRRLVETFLASPHFGERMAMPWLDAARFADSHGYHHDYVRSMSLWRDWLIRAFNENMPYDRFVIEQLAGDLLPDAGIEQKVATGFNRLHMINDEGGAIPDEYQVEYVVDRVRTTSTVFMGLTLACAQCHDHKYDPFDQEDYYRFYSFFNQVPEAGLDGSELPAPMLKVPRAEDRPRLEAIDARRRELEAERIAPIASIDREQEDWLRGLAADEARFWRPLHAEDLAAPDGVRLEQGPDECIDASGANPPTAVYEIRARTEATGLRALRLEAIVDRDLPEPAAGRAPNGNAVVSEIKLEAVSLADPQQRQPVRFVRALADHSQAEYDVALAIDGKAMTGWGLDQHRRRESRCAVFIADQPFGFAGGTRLELEIHQNFGGAHTLSRFRVAVSASIEVARDRAMPEATPWRFIGPLESGPAPLLTDLGPESDRDSNRPFGAAAQVFKERPELVDAQVHRFAGGGGVYYLRRSLLAAEAVVLRVSLGSDDAVAVFLNGRRVHLNDVARGVAPDQDQVDLELRAGENDLLVKVVDYGGDAGFYYRPVEVRPRIVPAALLAAARRSPTIEDPGTLDVARAYFRRGHWPRWTAIEDELRGLEASRAAIDAATPALMVMRDQPGLRENVVLVRGQYDRKGRPVTPGTPKSLPPLEARGAVADRLDLARWMVAPGHPLTARVAVNRIWYTLFGEGLVRSLEDFGVQGEWPTHPELLDRLACDFVASGYDVKALVRRIVGSATFRQSSRRRPELEESDPENRLLGRAPSYRHDGEILRDLALSISGLLDEEVGGESVKPYQPAGLWEEQTFRNKARLKDDFYQQDQGRALWRRGLYVFRKRSIPPPNLATLDSPTREVCIVRRSRTNTPLQALVLMNDPVFVEAARVLAQRTLREGGSSTEEHLEFMFELATSRLPDATEKAILQGALEKQLRRFRNDSDAATRLLAIGEAPRDETLEPVTLAAWTLVASLIFNLDETLTQR